MGKAKHEFLHQVGMLKMDLAKLKGELCAKETELQGVKQQDQLLQKIRDASLAAQWFWVDDDGKQHRFELTAVRTLLCPPSQ